MGNPNASGQSNSPSGALFAIVVVGRACSRPTTFGSLPPRPGSFSSGHNRWLSAAVCCLLFLWLAGCAAPPAEKSSVPPSSAPPTASAVSPPAAPATPPPPDANDPIIKAAAAPSAPFEGAGWKPLFDGHTLTGWREAQFAGRGEVEVRDGMILLKMGDPLTGVNYTNSLPTMNYEVALDAMRVSGSDFFCGLTVPVGDAFCSLIVGGWGGGLVGISSLDGMDASENETTKYVSFLQNHWYRVRLRVTRDRLEAWIDQDKLVDVVTADKKISLRPGEIEESKPFGLASYQTTAALRQIQIRQVDHPADPPKKY